MFLACFEALIETGRPWTPSLAPGLIGDCEAYIEEALYTGVNGSLRFPLPFSSQMIIIYIMIVFCGNYRNIIGVIQGFDVNWFIDSKFDFLGGGGVVLAL